MRAKKTRVDDIERRGEKSGFLTRWSESHRGQRERREGQKEITISVAAIVEAAIISQEVAAITITRCQREVNVICVACTGCWHSAVPMMAQRQGRRASIEAALIQHILQA